MYCAEADVSFGLLAHEIRMNQSINLSFPEIKENEDYEQLLSAIKL